MATQSIRSNQSVYEEFLDPGQLARVAQLRLRYSDTILKAQLTLSGLPEAQIRRKLASKAKERRETKKLDVQEKRAPREETPSLGVKKPQETKAEHCAAEIEKVQEIRAKRLEASHRREEDERRSKRQRALALEREAARAEINSMKQSVYLNNLGVIRELESLMGRPCIYYCDWLDRYNIRVL